MPLLHKALIATALACVAAPAAQAAEPLFVALGGYASCDGSRGPYGHALETEVEALRADLRRRHGIASRAVVSCFGERPFDLRYVVTGDRLAPRRAASFDDFFRAVEREATRGGDGPVVVVGHSHGGWLAMRTALALRTRLDLPLLYTIDPISYVRCAPDVFRRSVLAAIVSGDREPACTEAPPDLRADEGRLRRRVGRWTHYFQRSFVLLHSSPIGSATANHLMSYSWPEAARHHTDMKADPRIWEQIRSDVRRLLIRP